MKKLTLDLDSLGVETFSVSSEMALWEVDFFGISKKSCIEQCTTSCVP